MKYFTGILLILLFALPVFGQNAKIKRMCHAKWGADYTMVEHCYKQQMKAYKEYLTHIKKIPDCKLAVFAVRKWYDKEFNTCDFVMVMHTLKQQIKAVKKLAKLLKLYTDETSDEYIILGQALLKWKIENTRLVDYVMAVHTFESQLKAYKRLR